MNYRHSEGLFKDVSLNESKIIFIGSCAVILYAMISVCMVIYEVGDVFIKLIYIASVSLFPAMLFVVQKMALDKKSGQINNLGRSILSVNLLFVVLLTLFMVIGFLIQFLVEFQYFLMLSYFLIFFAKFHDNKFFNSFGNSNLLDKYMVLTLSFTVAIAFSCSLYFPFLQENFDFFKEAIKLNPFGRALPFFSILIMGVVFIGWVFFSVKNNTIKNYKIITLFLCFSPILLFDVLSNFDVEHYNAYLGPAIAVLHGKIPLVEVFCQYGLSYLVFTIAYIIFPNNYVVASAVVSVLNIVCWTVLLLILRRMIRNPLYFSVIALAQLFGSVYILVHTANLIPSTLCMRYFPTILFSYYLLCRLEDSSDETDKLNFFRLDAFNAIALLNIVWNIETLVSLCVLYGAYLWVMASTFKVFFKKIGMLCLFIFSIYLICAAVYLALFGEVPNYLMYLKYIYAYINPNIKAGGVFLSVPSDIYSRFFFWVILAVVHLVAFFYLINYRFCNKAQDAQVRMLLFFNTVCILFMSYFVLQPSLFSLINSGYPSFMFLFSILAMESQGTKRFEFRMCSKFLLCILTFFFFFMAVKSFFIQHKNFYKNGDLLYTIIHPRGFSLDRFLYNFTHFCSDKMVSPGAGPSLSIEENTCRKNNYHQELYNTVKKWYAKEKEILLFHRDSVEVLMEHHKVSKLFVNPINDSLVLALIDKTVGWLENKVHAGDIVVVEKDLNVLPIEYKVLMKMGVLFNFTLLEETPHLCVFKLVEKNVSDKSDLLFPIAVKKSRASFSYLPVFDKKGANMGIHALFDKDKETIWSVKKDMLNKFDTFWIWMDAGDTFWIDDVRIWRRIDFRKPDYVAENAFQFLNNFNLELSLDNKHWFMVTSEHNFENGNRYYYESKINHQKARYIRLNFFVNKADDLSISEIEVFGNKVVN